jgi:chromosome segregation ATPase
MLLRLLRKLTSGSSRVDGARLDLVGPPRNLKKIKKVLDSLDKDLVGRPRKKKKVLDSLNNWEFKREKLDREMKESWQKESWQKEKRNTNDEKKIELENEARQNENWRGLIDARIVLS